MTGEDRISRVLSVIKSDLVGHRNVVAQPSYPGVLP